MKNKHINWEKAQDIINVYFNKLCEPIKIFYIAPYQSKPNCDYENNLYHHYACKLTLILIKRNGKTGFVQYANTCGDLDNAKINVKHIKDVFDNITTFYKLPEFYKSIKKKYKVKDVFIAT